MEDAEAEVEEDVVAEVVQYRRRVRLARNVAKFSHRAESRAASHPAGPADVVLRPDVVRCAENQYVRVVPRVSRNRKAAGAEDVAVVDAAEDAENPDDSACLCVLAPHRRVSLRSADLGDPPACRHVVSRRFLHPAARLLGLGFDLVTVAVEVEVEAGSAAGKKTDTRTRGLNVISSVCAGPRAREGDAAALSKMTSVDTADPGYLPDASASGEDSTVRGVDGRCIKRKCRFAKPIRNRHSSSRV